MKCKLNLLSIVMCISFICNAQDNSHESFLKKSSKFDLTKYKSYPELNVDGNFKLIKTSDYNYFKSFANDQTIEIKGDNIGRVVVYSRLFKNIDSIQNKGELRIRAFQKNNKNPILTILKSFDYDVNQEFHYNFTSPNIFKVELNYTNADKNYWVIEKLKFSELNPSGIKVYEELESVLKKRQNLKENWMTLKAFDEKRVKNAIGYIRKQDNFVKFIQNKLETDDLEKTHNNLYNPTNNSSFDKELNNVFKNASVGNVKDLENSYESLKEGNWNDILLNVDEIVTGGKFQALISLIGNLFNSGKVKLKNDKEIVYTQLKDNFYAAEFKPNKKLTFRPIDDNDSEDISLSQIKRRQDTITALQEYVLMLRKFEVDDEQKKQNYLVQINLAKSELSKLKSAWVTLVTKIDSAKIFDDLESLEIVSYVDNDVLGPLSSCDSFEEYEDFVISISNFDKQVKDNSSRLLELASKVKNFNDTYYKDVYRNIENQKGRISMINSIQNLPNSISSQFETDALKLQNKYQGNIENKFQSFTKITFGD